MGRLKKLLNLLVLAVAGIVIWHEFIEPQRQSSADAGKPGGAGGSSGGGGGGTSPWDGVPSARDIVKAATGAGQATSDAAGDGPAAEGLAAAIAAINAVTERVTAVADDLAGRRSEESGSDGGSQDASDPRQMSSPSRFRGTGTNADDAPSGDARSGEQDDATAAATPDSSSRETDTGSAASGTGSGVAAQTGGEAGSAGASGSATEAVADTVADSVPVDAGSPEDGSATEDSQADARAADGGSRGGGADVAGFTNGELGADIATATGARAPWLDASATANETAGDEVDAEALAAAAEAARSAGADTTAGAKSESASATGATREGAGAAPVEVPAGAVEGDGTAECPAEYPIKGNASSMIYHQPGRASYDRTIPEFCFDTVDSAEAAGFRAPRH